MGMRPYAADCGALVLPLASKVKLRAPSKDFYGNNDDIRIEIPRQARDDRGARLLFCVTLKGREGFACLQGQSQAFRLRRTRANARRNASALQVRSPL